MAYTVGVERWSNSWDGNPRSYTLRATQVYRRENGEWRVVHRHGDELDMCDRELAGRSPSARSPVSASRTQTVPTVVSSPTRQIANDRRTTLFGRVTAQVPAGVRGQHDIEVLITPITASTSPNRGHDHLRVVAARLVGTVGGMTPTVQHELLPEVARSSNRSGRVIFLNGASCSGKTTLTAALQATLGGIWFRMAVDDFNLRLRDALAAKDSARDQATHQRMVLGFHRSTAAFARAGNDVIVDHVLGEQWRLDDCLQVFDGLSVTFVGLHCQLPELERRASERSNRRVGAARLQFPLVHQHGLYDIEVDSGSWAPEVCAKSVRDFVAGGEPPTAFATLRARLG